MKLQPFTASQKKQKRLYKTKRSAGTMIYGNIGQMCDYGFLEERIKECFAYAKKHDLAGIFKVLRQEDPKEIAEILNLLKQE